ncbi:uncharacterized protein [Zea mays]|uniref:uncharacterized protein n=1 Tax=Zea mays TaxID=4577 RepID=UPI0009A9B68F|nr:uncharacterized protein LOC103654591 [Zea mays]|eukprot:XP_008679653.2 uncharacterized protein LOC103654591 [Zea mays]
MAMLDPPSSFIFENIVRDIFIKNISDASLKITLCGDQASGFSIDNVCNQGNNKPIVIMFVGCLAKQFKGQSYLSGTAATTWYFNPDIPEAQEYYIKLQRSDLQMIKPTVAEEEFEVSQKPNIEDKTIQELLEMDLDMFPPQGFKCTATISRLIQDSKWWFPSCTKCKKSSPQTSTGYRCTSCGCTDVKFSYKLSFVATDGTCEAEFFCFDTIAKRIVGKPCDTLITTPIASQGFPPDLAAIVSLKFTFVVTLYMSAFSVTNKVSLSYMC